MLEILSKILFLIVVFVMLSNISCIQMNLQYTVLQAALILTITANLYINPPVSFDSTAQNDAFSSLSGFAAFTHLLCIINSTIISGVLNMAYSGVGIPQHQVRTFFYIMSQ